MIISETTEARIIKAMEHGAVLCFHRWGDYNWGEYETGTSKVTLNHGESSLLISPPFDDTYRFDKDGDYHLTRCDHESRAARSLAMRITERPDVRDDYLPGSRWEGCKQWIERYVHISTPTPRWVTEQWTFDEFGNPEGDYSK